jgi:molybdopterin/thiamine biosynthesis adenylyltransferase
MNMSSRFQEIGLSSATAPCAGGRLPTLFGYAGDVGKHLASLHVLVLAAGSVGFAIALLLARLGVGWLDIVDPKRLKPQSLVTHQGLRPEDVGEFKALAAARACAALGTGTRVRCFIGTSHGVSRADLAGVDYAIASPDNLVAELSMGHLCLQHGIPLFHASVHGQTLVAQVRVYANSSADSPTPACGFTRRFVFLARDSRPRRRRPRFPERLPTRCPACARWPQIWL